MFYVNVVTGIYGCSSLLGFDSVKAELFILMIGVIVYIVIHTICYFINMFSKLCFTYN